MFVERTMWHDGGDAGFVEHATDEEARRRYCFGGKGGGTNTVSQVQIPEWMQAAGQDNYNRAAGIGDRPYQQYGGQRVADQPWQAQNVADRVAAIQGQGQIRIDDATRATQNVAGFEGQAVGTDFHAQQMGAHAASAANRDSYMNPYLAQVRDTGLAALEQSRLKAISQTGDQAMASGAFGGSRHAVMEAQTNAAAAQKAAEFAGQVGAQGWDAASQLMQGDVDRVFQADQNNLNSIMQAQQLRLAGQTTNANTATQAAQLRLGAANQLGNLASLGNQVAGREIAMQDAVAQQQRAHQQQLLDSAGEQWTDAFNWNSGLTGLGIRESALGMAPYGQTTSTKSDGGGGASTAGLAVGGAMAGATIASALSDERRKDNMRKVGRDDATGLDIFSFDYEGDGPRGAKRVGLSAQQVEEKFPEAVTEVGGVKSLLFGELPAHLRPLVSGQAAPPAITKKKSKKGAR